MPPSTGSRPTAPCARRDGRRRTTRTCPPRPCRATRPTSCAAGRRPRLRVVRRHPGGRPRHHRLVLPPASRRRHVVDARAALRRPDPLGAEPDPLHAPPTGRCGCSTRPSRPATRTPPRCGAASPATAGARGGPRRRCSPPRRRRRLRPAAARRARRAAACCCPIFHCVTVPGEKWVGNERHSARDDLRRRPGRPGPRRRCRAALGCVHMNIVAVGDGSLWPCSAAAGPTRSREPAPPTTA